MKNLLFHHLESISWHRLAAKRDFVVRCGGAPDASIDPACLAQFNRDGREAFLAVMNDRPGAPMFSFSFNLR